LEQPGDRKEAEGARDDRQHDEQEDVVAQLMPGSASAAVDARARAPAAMTRVFMTFSCCAAA
ncbi:hypothetical protein ACIKTA_04885, partial [Hansschlegelia beijingensis]